MKNINEMTEQEILALTEEDVQKMIKFRMMEEGIKIMDRPRVPELFEVEPADLEIFTIPIFSGFAFTNMEEANAVAKALIKAKTLRKVDYDWQKMGSDYKYLVKQDRYSFYGDSDFSIQTSWAYSNELYNKIVDFAVQNKSMKEQAEKDQKEYENQLQESSGIVSEIRERVKEVNMKYERLESLVWKFATDYYPLSDNNEDMAIKFMSKAYSLTDEEKTYILDNYTNTLQDEV